MSAAYRVWADGTVQAVEDGQAYNWMSDDYAIVGAESEEEAVEKYFAEGGKRTQSPCSIDFGEEDDKR